MVLDIFKNYILQHEKLSTVQWDLVKSMATSVFLIKEDIIIRSNEKFDKEVFIKKGVVRGFIVDEQGNEKSTSFFEAGDFISTNTFKNKHGRSVHNYPALCKTQLLTFNEYKLKEFFSNNKLLIQIGKRIKEKEMERISSRDRCLLQVNSIERYNEFLNCYPNIEQLIAQKHIPSYLGITPVSLSRTKTKLISFDNKIENTAR